MEDEPLYRLIMPDGMHLANPQDDPSVYLGAFFDDENHLKGQARWEPVFDNTDDGDGAEIGNDDGDTPAAAVAAAAIAIAAIVGTAYYLANNETFRSWWDKTVVHWWEDSVKPTMGKLWNKVTRRSKKKAFRCLVWVSGAGGGGAGRVVWGYGYHVVVHRRPATA